MLKYVDLYLIHNPRMLEGSLENTWHEMEKAKKFLEKTTGAKVDDKPQGEDKSREFFPPS